MESNRLLFKLWYQDAAKTRIKNRNYLCDRDKRRKTFSTKKVKLLESYSRKQVFRKSSMDDLVKPPEQPSDVDEEQEPQVQAFLFDSTKYPGETEVKLWLTDHNYPEAEIHLSDTSEESHIAICFDVDLCEAESGRREETVTRHWDRIKRR